MTARVGQVIGGKYRVERVLGEGGMGVVLGARDLELRRRVALKLLRKDAMADGAAERFLREARATAAIESPHVARVLDVGRARGGEPYLVLEHLEGEDLHARLSSGPPARIGDAVRWILEACEGLAAAHARGVVHRDLKPSNLFLARQPDGREVVKLLDFGLAKDPDDADGCITATGAILGSPSYMSPEHLAGRRVDVRSDIWSLGVTLYELLARALPFPGNTTPEICAAVLSSPPVPISVHRHDVPPDLDALIVWCLAKDPTKRPADVAEVAAMLEPFAEVPGAAARVAHTLAHATDEAPGAIGARDAPTHLVSSVDARVREGASGGRAVAIGVAAAAIAACAAAVVVAIAMRRTAPVAARAPTPVPTETASIVYDTVAPSAIAAPSATPSIAPLVHRRARPHATTRPRPAPSHDPLERF